MPTRFPLARGGGGSRGSRPRPALVCQLARRPRPCRPKRRSQPHRRKMPRRGGLGTHPGRARPGKSDRRDQPLFSCPPELARAVDRSDRNELAHAPPSHTTPTVLARRDEVGAWKMITEISSAAPTFSLWRARIRRAVSTPPTEAATLASSACSMLERSAPLTL